MCFSLWSAVRSDNLLHWLLFLTLSSIIPPSLLSSFQSLCHPCCTAPSVAPRLTLTFSRTTMSPMCAHSLCLFLCSPINCRALFVCLFDTRTQKRYVLLASVIRRCRKQCTGMGVRGGEGGEVAFQRCRRHPVAHTCTQRGCWLDNGLVSGVLVGKGALPYLALHSSDSIPCALFKEFTRPRCTI